MPRDLNPSLTDDHPAALFHSLSNSRPFVLPISVLARVSLHPFLLSLSSHARSTSISSFPAPWRRSCFLCLLLDVLVGWFVFNLTSIIWPKFNFVQVLAWGKDESIYFNVNRQSDIFIITIIWHPTRFHCVHLRNKIKLNDGDGMISRKEPTTTSGSGGRSPQHSLYHQINGSWLTF